MGREALNELMPYIAQAAVGRGDGDSREGRAWPAMLDVPADMLAGARGDFAPLRKNGRYCTEKRNSGSRPRASGGCQPPRRAGAAGIVSHDNAVI